MFRSLLFHLINVYALFTVETLDQCRKDCLVDPWSSWRSCSGPCGHQKQIRGRKLCCDEALKPWNWEHCLQHCNLPNTFENLQFKQCRVCKNGGKLLSISDPCICSSRYKGDCCEGRNENIKSPNQLMIIANPGKT